MSFDYEALMGGDTDYGLDAFLRAITKAAYYQGLEQGLAMRTDLEDKMRDISEVVRSISNSFTSQNGLFLSPKIKAHLETVRANGGLQHRPLVIEDPMDEKPPVRDMARRNRVARGLVQQTVATALELDPGKSIKDYEALVLDLEPDISIKSIGNELRRGEADGRYKRDRPGGYRWYLASSEIEAADNEPTEAAASYSNNGGDDEPDNMT